MKDKQLTTDTAGIQRHAVPKDFIVREDALEYARLYFNQVRSCTNQKLEEHSHSLEKTALFLTQVVLILISTAADLLLAVTTSQ